MLKKEDTKIKPRIYTRDEHSVSRKNIDSDALKIMRRLMRNGYKAYLVGGAVRDLLLGKTPKDFDIATDATPRRVKSLFRNCRIIGRRFKLAHIYFGNGKLFEVSTFRAMHDEITAEDLNSDEVEEKDLILMDDNVYGDECSDALRRDITINALFYSLKNFSVIDYTGGMEDLRNGIVRVIGDPEIRFLEDPVRMLRAVRHAVRAGCKLDQSCVTALTNRHLLIEQCSGARLYEELKKDLTSGYAVEILQQYAEHHLLQHLLPEISRRQDELLQTRSLFARSLKRVDAYALSNGLESITPILSVMAVFVANEDPEAPLVSTNFNDRHEISTFMHDNFKRLLVPRKERERITDIMEMIRVLETAAERSAIVRRLHKYSSFEDAKLVLNFLNVDKRTQGLIDRLSTGADTDKKESRPQRSYKPWQRRKGGRRNR